MTLNDDVKYILAWLIPITIGTILLFTLLAIYAYKINSKFIEKGYQQTMVAGYSSPVWQVIKCP